MNIFCRIFIGILIIVCSVMYFTHITYLSKSGDVLVTLQQEIDILEKENRSLVLKLNQKFSLQNIEKVAKESGMVSDINFVYVKKASSLAISKR